MFDRTVTHYTLSDLKAQHLTETGYVIDGVYRLVSLDRRRTCDGRAYLKVRLTDLSGQMDGYGWMQELGYVGGLGSCDLVRAIGRLREFKGETVTDLDYLVAVNTHELEGQELLSSLPISLCPEPQALQELAGILDGLRHSRLRQFVRDVVESPACAFSFLTASGGQGSHHDQSGGLVLHTLDTLKQTQSQQDLPVLQQEVVLVKGMLRCMENMCTTDHASRYVSSGIPISYDELWLSIYAPALQTLGNTCPQMADFFWQICRQASVQNHAHKAMQHSMRKEKNDRSIMQKNCAAVQN